MKTKKIFSILSAIAVTAILSTSCVSTKKIVYFQGSDSLFLESQKIAQQYEMRLKPADQVLIKITCSEPTLLQIFAQDVTMGTSGQSGNYMNSTTGSMGSAYGYTVTNSGDLVLPAVGNVHVDHMTVTEAGEAIEKVIKEKGLIIDPIVTVRLLNARVTVIGAANSSRVVNLTSERNTIVDVLAQCGDVDDAGLRQNIKLYREENGQLAMYNIDLTSANIFKSPAYYVQQNDMIYVEPNKSKRVKSSPFYTALAAWGSIIGAVSTAVSLGVLIYKTTGK